MKTSKFKMTELGPIPVDWEVKRIIDVAPLQRGFDLPFSHLMEGVVPVVYSNGIGAYHSKGMCKGPGLVTGRSGTIGKFFYIESGDYWPHNTTLWVTDFYGNNPLFVKYLYETLDFEDFSTGTGVPTLNRNSVHEHKVVIPPLAEQRRIAGALSDIDELISALGKLIEKKRNIKTGAMQELLGMRNSEFGMRNVPRRRLAGFSGEWVEKRLGDYAIVARGGSPRPIEAFLTSHDDGLNWVKIGDVGVGAKYIERTAEKILPSGLSSTRMVYPGDFLLSNSMSFGRPYIMKITGCIHDGWLVIQNYKSTFDTEYLYYVLGSEMVVNQYRVLAAGSSVLNLNKDVVARVIVVVPPTLAEQKAIAAVLSDMDAEIAALEADRTKYERIKSGMMQELLTGKTRLKGE